MAIWSTVVSLKDCPNGYIPLATNQAVTVSSPNYPNGFLIGSDCETEVVAPIHHQLQIACYFHVGVNDKFNFKFMLSYQDNKIFYFTNTYLVLGDCN